MLPGTGDGVTLSTSDVSALYGIPVGTVHRWASEDGWERHGPRTDRRWSVEQVQASHDRRRGCGSAAQLTSPPTGTEDPA